MTLRKERAIKVRLTRLSLNVCLTLTIDLPWEYSKRRRLGAKRALKCAVRVDRRRRRRLASEMEGLGVARRERGWCWSDTGTNTGTGTGIAEVGVRRHGLQSLMCLLSVQVCVERVGFGGERHRYGIGEGRVRRGRCHLRWQLRLHLRLSLCLRLWCGGPHPAKLLRERFRAFHPMRETRPSRRVPREHWRSRMLDVCGTRCPDTALTR